MIRSVWWSFLFGYVMVCSFVLALPDQKDAAGVVTMDGVSAGADQGWNCLQLADAGRRSLIPEGLIIIGIVVSNFLCALAGLTSCSRMMYAFARDGGLPLSRQLRKVDPALRTPGAAIWVGGVLSIIATLYGGAFLCAVHRLRRVPLSLLSLAHNRGSMVGNAGKWTNKGPFNLAGASIAVAVLAIIGCAILIFVGVQPPQEKVGYLIVMMILALIGFWQSMEGRMPVGLVFGLLTAAVVYYFWHVPGENFGLYAAIVVAVIMAVLIFVLKGKRFAGPPIGGEIAKRQAIIAAQEKALAAGE